MGGPASCLVLFLGGFSLLKEACAEYLGFTMRKRPIGIVILAIVHLVAPLFFIIYAATAIGISPFGYAKILSELPLSSKVEFYLLSPIAGLAIYRVRPWSYPIFLFAVGLTAFRYYQYHTAFPHLLSIWVLAGVFLADILVVSYFFTPTILSAYFNARMRWWESKPRYVAKIECEVRDGQAVITGATEDISVGGCFLRTEGTLGSGEVIGLHFEHGAMSFDLKARVVYCGGERRPGYGLHFIEVTFKVRRQLGQLIRKLKRSGAMRR
ncbi:MAG: hypothetical protein A2X94_12160 [Bdellovibrionales bacterium GWB1_55_8]|nr:MAG: hypothetical protein A2X94_12160 [Bdellovibrionales bacterium GWB1_55_8]